jgi:hypothetical protein
MSQNIELKYSKSSKHTFPQFLMRFYTFQIYIYIPRTIDGK